MNGIFRISTMLITAVGALGPVWAGSPPLASQKVILSGGISFGLNMPPGWTIRVAAEGLRCPRFMAFSPDGRLFIGGMYNRDDTNKGRVYVLEGFDPATGRFKEVSTFLSGLRNPNSVAFHTEPGGRQWFYLALTDRLLRFPYRAGEKAPSGSPQTLATFPDYGLNYKYGGWHLTRTLCVGGNGKLYVSVGSSCDSCVEKPGETRACVLEMDPDGRNQKIFATGLRNAVGLKWVQDGLVATNMGSDKLGNDQPLETVYRIKEGADYGWPYCYVSKEGLRPDPKYEGVRLDPCGKVSKPLWIYEAHSAPLGIEYFGKGEKLEGSYLVAFHGSGKKTLGRGYKVVRMEPGREGEDFITGFLDRGKVVGRPCDVLKDGRGGFFMTDDFRGVVYHLSPEPAR